MPILTWRPFLELRKKLDQILYAHSPLCRIGELVELQIYILNRQLGSSQDS